MGVFVAYQSCRGLTSFVSLYARGTLTDGPSRPGEFVTFRSDVQYVPVPADRRETAAVHPSPTVRAEHTRFSNQLRFLRRHQHNNCNGDDNDNICSYDIDCAPKKRLCSLPLTHGSLSVACLAAVSFEYQFGLINKICQSITSIHFVVVPDEH